MTTELELDHIFWRTISSDMRFQSWFLNRTKFGEIGVDLIADEKWHQRWYRDPDTGKDSETDILLMIRNRSSGARYAIHIENKPDHGKWEQNQAENYKKRALNRMSAWRYVDFQTVLIAPESFIARSSEEAMHFNVLVSYEEIRTFIPEFRSR
jgi:hypothetical protein